VAAQTAQDLETVQAREQDDAASLQPLGDQVGRTVAQLAVLRAQAAAEIHAVLTPEQRVKARQLYDQFRNRLRQHWMQQAAGCYHAEEWTAIAWNAFASSFAWSWPN
jgi:Spy/CpxP family protein refolding chaperone